MTDIYAQHQQAFRNVEAFVITDNVGERVATVAFKYAASGLRTTCFLHVLGVPMVKAYASGGGYDKASAAVYAACKRVKDRAGERLINAFTCAVKDEGEGWGRDLTAAGFKVLQAA